MLTHDNNNKKYLFSALKQTHWWIINVLQWFCRRKEELHSFNFINSCFCYWVRGYLLCYSYNCCCKAYVNLLWISVLACLFFIFCLVNECDHRLVHFHGNVNCCFTGVPIVHLIIYHSQGFWALELVIYRLKNVHKINKNKYLCLSFIFIYFYLIIVICCLIKLISAGQWYQNYRAQQ